MLTEDEGEGEGDVPLDGVKTAEEFRFYSTQSCSADFQQRSVTVVEFGARPSKKARPSSDKIDLAKESQVCNFFTGRLVRDSYIEKKDANVIETFQTHQADKQTSDKDSGITNELCIKSAGMKVVGSVEASEYDEKKGNIKVPAAQDDVATGFVGSEGGERNDGSTMIEQHADDTASTSSDEGVFVIKMRSPTSKQLLHGPKLGINQEELHNCPVAASMIIVGVQDAYDSSEIMGHCHGGGHDVDDRFMKSMAAEDEDRTELDAEKVETSVEVANVILEDAGNKMKICCDIEDQHMQLAAADFRGENLDTSKSTQEAKVSPIHRNYSECTVLDEAYEHQSNEPIRNDAENVAPTEIHSSLEGVVQNDAEKTLEYCVSLDRELLVVPTRVMDEEIIDVGKLEAVKEDRTLAPGSVGSRSNISDDSHQVSGYQEDHCNGCEDDTGVDRVRSDTATSENKKSLLDAEFVGDLDHPTILLSSSGSFSTGDICGKFENHINTHDQVEHRKVQEQSSLPAGMKNFGKTTLDVPIVGVSDSGPRQDLGVDASDVVKVYARKRKRGISTEVVEAESAALKEHNGFSKLEDVSRSQLKDQEPLNERIIKYYSRRSLCRMDPHHPAAMTQKSNQLMVASASKGEESVSLPQVEHHKDISSKLDDTRCLLVKDEEPLGERVIKHYVRRSFARPDTYGPADKSVKPTQASMTSVFPGEESIPLPQADASAEVDTEVKINVFRRRSKENPSQQTSLMNDCVDLQCKVTEDHTAEGYVRPDHQPRWLPEGWILEIRVRDGKKTPVRIRDKYYFDQKSGHRFRSRNEVLQFLDRERLGRDQMASGAPSRKVQSQNLEGPTSSAPSLVAPSPCSTRLLPARMKSTPMRSASAVLSQGNGSDLSQPQEEDRNGSSLLRCGGTTFPGVRERGLSDSLAKNVVTAALDGGAANSPPPLGSHECDRLISGSPVPAAESPSDQGDKENRGKLIFRLKRKQPDSDTGKGRSKRPMYEVVHGEKASSSTSTPSRHENKLSPGEKTGQVLTPGLDSASTQVERTSAKKPLTSSLGHNFLTNSMSTKTQVVNHVPALDVSSQSVPEQPAVVNPVIENAVIHHTPQHLDLFQEPYTALGIPATARSSGLQHMASYSANHTHVFLDPVENTIPLSWQYYFTTQAPVSITTSVPTLGPFPSLFNTSVSRSHSVTNTVPIPIFEHFKGASSSMQLNAASTLYHYPASGMDNRTRDSSSNVRMAESVPQTQKASAPKALTKEQNSQLLLGLGRRLCLAGVEQKPKYWSSQLQTRATNLQDQGQQGFLQALSRMQ